MGLGRGKSEQGSGGKRGHSGQENAMYHQEEKALARRIRRLNDKKIASQALKENLPGPDRETE